MVVLNKIYTRTGDNGTTALGSGERRMKYDLRVSSYGTVDETNATIGMARALGELDQEMDQMLSRIQNDLFDLGADLATPETDKEPPYPPLRIIDSQVDRIEADIDVLNVRLEPLRSFVLPGGSKGSAYLHLTRTISRRAERLMVELAEQPGEHVNPAGIRYMNRLSDFMFVAARCANDDGQKDVLWVPGENR